MNTGLAYAIGAAVTWGMVYTVDQKILASASPLALLLMNAIITIVVVAPFIYFDRGSVVSLVFAGRANLLFLLLSISFSALANFLIFSAIKSIGASSASVIEIAYPFFVGIFSAIMLGDAPSMSLTLGGIFIFAGAAIITLR